MNHLVPSQESKHDKFFRLMHKRLFRALEALRLISQLSSSCYENTNAEAEEVVALLDKATHKVATSFSVPYKSAIGKVHHPGPKSFTVGRIDETDFAKAIDLIRSNKTDEAVELLKLAFSSLPRQ